MRLGTKLVIMSVFAILIPMLIIMIYSAFMIYQSSANSQLEYLGSIAGTIERDIVNTEENYREAVRLVAKTDLVRDKLYVYEKYWTRLTDSLIAYDLESLNSYIENIALERDIEIIAVYRRVGEEFLPVTVIGPSDYLPEVLDKSAVQRAYDKAVYKRFPDGICVDVKYPVFSDGKLVGLIQFMHAYNENFFSGYAETFNIDFALSSMMSLMFNSVKTTDEAVSRILNNHEGDGRVSFRVGSNSYTGLIMSFNLGEDAAGRLVLYDLRSNIFGEDSYLIQRLLAMTLLCIMIPVVTFFVKEIRLIRSINALLSATDSISSGDYESSVEVRSRDELGMLSANFNEMVRVLKKNREDLELQNTELALKNSYIDAVFQSLRINIIVLDPELRIQVVSKNAGSRLELTEDQYGQKFLEVEPFSRESRILGKTFEELLLHKKFSRLHTIKFDNISFEMDFYPVMQDSHNLSAIVLILNNITDRMNMERALIQSDRLASVGKLAAGLAHEINNPMGVILNHVQLLQSDKLTDDEKKRFINRMESEIKRVSRLINSLLKFSREENLQPERILLGEIFTEVIGLFDPKARSGPLAEFFNGRDHVAQPALFFRMGFRDKLIEFYISDQLMKHELVCERDSLKQILFNIIKNAFESVGMTEGIISAEVEKSSDATQIRLTDNGCGISADELVNVFELFYTRGKPGSGVGLGLPLCRRLMNNLGGEIGIESEKAKGTRVTMLFPDREGFYG